MSFIFRRRMFGVLAITDGTTRVDLLTKPGKTGLTVVNWLPAIEDYKDGGIWADSPIADGRQPVDGYKANVVNSLELTAQGNDQDQLARVMQDFRRLLGNGYDYWATDWADEVLWIEAQSYGETNKRYAQIYKADVPSDGFPYGQPFLHTWGDARFDDLILTLERGPWLETAPATAGTAIETSVIETYDGRALGNVDDAGDDEPTTADEVYIINRRQMANITHVYYWDSVGGAWSGNLMNAALPFALFQNPVAAGDVILFGIDTSVADSGPFMGLVLDIGVAQNDLTTIVWRYSAGGADPTAWQALTVQDNTNADGAMTGDAFDTTGVGSVHWEVPSIVVWTTQNPQVGIGPVLGVTGYWVAAHVTVVGAAPTPPTQQNRDIYAVTQPYVDIADDQVEGGLPALSRILVHSQADDDGTGSGTPALVATRLIIGLRTYDRGADFTAYINTADRQNPAFMTVAATGAGAMVTATEAPAGRCIEVTNPAAVWASYGSIEIDAATAAHFYGTFHMFLRPIYIGGATSGVTLRVYYGTGSASLYRYTREVDLPSGNYPVLDMGIVTLPPGGGIRQTDFGTLYFNLQVYGNGVADFRMYDMILMPVDEWSIDTATPTVGAGLGARQTEAGGGRYLDIDSIGYPKYTPRSILRAFATDYALGSWSVSSSSDSILQANVHQRLWFMSLAVSTSLTRNEIAHSIRVRRQQRYYSLRGDR